MSNVVDTLLDWIDIASVTGDEADYADAVARRLEAEGFGVEKQSVAPGRFNLLARAGLPKVVLCTHLDTVPPWFGPSRKGSVVKGRGACDAKGPLVSMLKAARELLSSGEERVGFLLTVGEEIDSAGARVANERLTEPWSPRFVIVGEPTDNLWIRGGKGIFKCGLKAHGIAGHSSQNVGPSAVHELVHTMGGLLQDKWGEHAHFGEGTINIGVIGGGLAPNVVAPEAEAEVLVRAVEPPDVVRARIAKHLGEHVEMTNSLGYGPIAFDAPNDEQGPVVAFGTDAPYLKRWGTPLLYGPGRILDAHTAHEQVTVDELEQASRDYADAARALLARDES
jgi:acetylornithine deacetylase